MEMRYERLVGSDAVSSRDLRPRESDIAMHLPKRAKQITRMGPDTLRITDTITTVMRVTSIMPDHSRLRLVGPIPKCGTSTSVCSASTCASRIGA